MGKLKSDAFAYNGDMPIIRISWKRDEQVTAIGYGIRHTRMQLPSSRIRKNQLKLGVIPAAHAEAVRERQPVVDAEFVAAVAAREAITDHDVAAFVDVVQERIGAPEGSWVHHGLTSTDVVEQVSSICMGNLFSEELPQELFELAGSDQMSGDSMLRYLGHGDEALAQATAHLGHGDEDLATPHLGHD